MNRDCVHCEYGFALIAIVFVHILPWAHHIEMCRFCTVVI